MIDDIDLLYEIITLFEEAPRLGSDLDSPEGVRYIQISETLIKEFIRKARYLKNKAIDCGVEQSHIITEDGERIDL